MSPKWWGIECVYVRRAKENIRRYYEFILRTEARAATTAAWRNIKAKKTRMALNVTAAHVTGV